MYRKGVKCDLERNKRTKTNEFYNSLIQTKSHFVKHFNRSFQKSDEMNKSRPECNNNNKQKKTFFLDFFHFESVLNFLIFVSKKLCSLKRGLYYKSVLDF